ALAFIEGGADGGSVRHVDAVEDRPAPLGRGDLLRDGPTLDLVEIGDDDREAVRRESGRDRSADPAGRAGNDCPTEVIGWHGSLPPVIDRPHHVSSAWRRASSCRSGFAPRSMPP